MTTIYLIRHAQAEGNLYRRCQGWYNSLITVKGYRQIDALEQRFRDIHFDAVYSSDLFRAMTTARAIYRSHSLPLRTDPQLREIGTGCWEDRPWGDLLRQDRSRLLAFWRCDPACQVPGGESYISVQARSCGAIERIARAHPDQTVAIVAHGTVIRCALARWLGRQIGDVPHGDNTCVARLEYQNGNVTVRYYNDVSHLPPELTYTPHGTDDSDEALAADLERSSLYFRPLSPAQEKDLCLSALQESQLTGCGELNSVLVAMQGDRPVGLLQLDPQDQSKPGAGHISLLCLIPEARYNGLGVQLLGQAVSTYRTMGRQRLWLCCAPENAQARRFLESHGFRKTAEKAGVSGRLDILEKYIGYDEQ